MPERVLILGATSAIAAEVAAIHASRGDQLHLIGRNREKLQAVYERCAATKVTTRTADFSALGSNDEIVRAAFDLLVQVDRVLIAHGDLGDQVRSEQSFDEAEAILRTNLISVVSLLVPIANQLESQRHGRLGVITSVAGERGRPRNYTYGAAKAGLNTYLQGLRTRLHPASVSVTTLKVGPVDTPMTATHSKHPLFSKPGVVARDIVRAMDGKAAEVYIPARWGVIMPIVKRVPERLFQRVPFLSGR